MRYKSSVVLVWFAWKRTWGVSNANRNLVRKKYFYFSFSFTFLLKKYNKFFFSYDWRSDHLIVSDTWNHRLQVLTRQGNPIRVICTHKRKLGKRRGGKREGEENSQLRRKREEIKERSAGKRREEEKEKTRRSEERIREKKGEEKEKEMKRFREENLLNLSISLMSSSALSSSNEISASPPTSNLSPLLVSSAYSPPVFYIDVDRMGRVYCPTAATGHVTVYDSHDGTVRKKRISKVKE